MPKNDAAEHYATRAVEYAEVLGSVDASPEGTRRLIGEWADALDGPVLDLGCGPGHWTAWLACRGVDVTGLDPVPAFIDHARRAYPGVRVGVGSAETLEPAESFAGILAWFSLIHHEPDEAERALRRIVRSLRPGGVGSGRLLRGRRRRAPGTRRLAGVRLVT